jgi:hypothetical protein
MPLAAPFTHRSLFEMSQLVEMVEHHLLNAMVESERPESVVETVVTEYLLDVKMSGAVPISCLAEVTEELRDLALEIIRKRTYGCHTLAEYRRRTRIPISDLTINGVSNDQKPKRL